MCPVVGCLAVVSDFAWLLYIYLVHYAGSLFVLLLLDSLIGCSIRLCGGISGSFHLVVHGFFSRLPNCCRLSELEIDTALRFGSLCFRGAAFGLCFRGAAFGLIYSHLDFLHLCLLAVRVSGWRMASLCLI
jgi:hypothetical protein